MTQQIGCFGSVLYHDPASNRCGRCPALEECKEQVAANAILLTEILEAAKDDKKGKSPAVRARAAKAVETVAHPHTVVPTAVPGVTSLNKKPREFVEKWAAKGIKFLQYREDGQNPFNVSGNKFAQVAMQVFLDRKTVTWDELYEVFTAPDAKGTPTWMGYGTASSHTNIVFEAFKFLGIITVDGNTGYLK